MPMTLLNSGVTGQNLTKCINSIARSSQMNVSKSEVRYCNPFPTARATNKGKHRPILPILPLTWLR